MRFSIIAVLASVVAVTSALEYPFKPNGPCVSKCLMDIGKSMNPNYTDDPNSPYFLESLGYGHERGTPTYTTFMYKAGMCYQSCPKEELDLYQEQFQAKAEWYKKAKAEAEAKGAAGDGANKPSAANGLVAGSSAFIGAAAAVVVALL
ncbi:hypothetical protein BX616_002017 [Lobosporangium transversale]|uniref:Uncharacterized protein n=1 Tax=Lobosporangium transversale TaxID=64571 RepID=A0A1Y2GV74_9FUNG|nr:hypothetical protein BCR41DRAFT_349811 [Lobosporangium transversale]KAF9902180.1 hypothetical protein BX616_002017 [Lobosporangium transversale]ORZ22862.1 hypothetical protein BCR41DRAFT_349811 [Lobosporangium transversale]|eukprot:XP_021883416.1 hypothetical protein BCR41DRAFT_349811 [Lobosporangium transversale]